MNEQVIGVISTVVISIMRMIAEPITNMVITPIIFLAPNSII